MNIPETVGSLAKPIMVFNIQHVTQVEDKVGLVYPFQRPHDLSLVQGH
jgi:hypothetical protein